jgi:hypothetical protein
MCGESVTCLSAPCPADARRFHCGEEPSSRGATAMWLVVAPLVTSSAYSPSTGKRERVGTVGRRRVAPPPAQLDDGNMRFARFESAIRIVGEEPQRAAIIGMSN